MATDRFRYQRVLISGGSGFIGSATALALLERGVRVRIIDNLLPQVHGTDVALSPTYRAIKDHVEFVHDDVRDANAWRAALKDQEAVIHLAALTGTGQSMYRIAEYTGVNVGGTAILLEQLAEGRHSVDRVVVASSRSIYGEGKYKRESDGRIMFPGPRRGADLDAGIFDVLCESSREPLKAIPTDEESVISPASVYAITKLSQEQLILKLCDGLGIASVALRYQNVYGPGQSLQNPYTGILSVFSRAILEGREVNVFEDGLASRDFVYIADVVSANLAALEASARTGFSVNVGTGAPVTVLGALQILAECLGKEPKFRISGNYRIGDIRSCVADTARMNSLLLNADAMTPFAIGCKVFTEWVGQVGSMLGETTSYDASLDEMKSRRLMR